MKVTDIVEYETGTANSKEIISKLQSLGYESLGYGLDATVWTKEEGTVIKILMPSRTFPNDVVNAEKGFMTFYNFCQENKNSPNLPKFIDIGGKHHTVFELNGVEYRQIAMERLRPLTNGSFEELMVWMLSDLAKIRAPWNNIVAMLKKPDTWVDHQDANMPALVTKYFADPAKSKEYGMLYQIMGKLYHTGLKAGLGWDLHTENAMQRSDGTIVIVDPYHT